MSKPVVTTFDVCVPGFERLRGRDEILLAAPIDANTSPHDLISDWICQIHMQELDGADPVAVDAVVREYTKTQLDPLFVKDNPFGLESWDDPDVEWNGPYAFLYLRVR